MYTNLEEDLVNLSFRFKNIVCLKWAFDNNLNRLGYGAGYYDRLITKLNKRKKILTIGLALTIQKINNIPVTKYDKKLDYIVTDKYIL